jgi:hypothetical protein
MEAARGISRTRFYGVLLVMLAASYAWIGYNGIVRAQQAEGISICIVRTVTGVPCPGCGTTRSVLHVLHGDVLDAVMSNPFGLLAVAALSVLPFWIAVDLARGRASLMHAYDVLNHQLARRAVRVVIVLLVLCVWTWNIYNQGIGT